MICRHRNVYFLSYVVKYYAAHLRQEIGGNFLKLTNLFNLGKQAETIDGNFIADLLEFPLLGPKIPFIGHKHGLFIIKSVAHPGFPVGGPGSVRGGMDL